MSRSLSKWMLGALLLAGALAISMAGCHDKSIDPDDICPLYRQSIYTPSCDSTYCYFVDRRASPGIYRVPYDGGTHEPELVVAGNMVRSPAVSPDGTKLAFVQLYQALWVLDLKTGIASKLLDGDILLPKWVGDTALIYDVFGIVGFSMVNVATSATTVIYSDTGFSPTACGERVAFLKRAGRLGELDTVLVNQINFDGSGEKELARFVHLDVRYPVWSWDCKFVVLNYTRCTQMWIVTIDAESHAISPILARYGVEPSFTPDGRIVYVWQGQMAKNETDQVWMMNADGSGKEMLVP